MAKEWAKGDSTDLRSRRVSVWLFLSKSAIGAAQAVDTAFADRSNRRTVAFPASKARDDFHQNHFLCGDEERRLMRKMRKDEGKHQPERWGKTIDFPGWGKTIRNKDGGQ